MSRTRTIFVDLQRLQLDPDSASIIINLMMAANDIALANQCLKKIKSEESRIRRPIQRGAAMYFIRLQCGHLNEGLKVIQDIKDNKQLFSRVKLCSQTAKDSFEKMADCLKGGKENKKFEQYVGRIRHNTIFHYDKKLINKALAARAGRKESSRSKITLGDDISLFRFELSDDIVDSIVCREICKVPRNADLRKEIDDIMDWASDKAMALIDFAGEFIYKYIIDHAAV